MVKEVLDAVQHATTERLRNPLIGTFALSWLVTNWKLAAILIFDSTPIEKRIQLLESRADSISLILVPLVATAFYVVGMPWIALAMDRIQVSPVARRKRNGSTAN